jgi:membrane-associated protease RseP (regulator of RpoE activity)
MDEAAARKDAPSVLTEIPRYTPPEAPVAPPQIAARAGVPPLNIALFAVTLLTTTMGGAYMAGADLSLMRPLASFSALGAGLSFSIPLMAILLAHEMGHFLTARRHRVDTSYPYFVPAPFPSYFFIGTFGAFISIRSRPDSRRVMFDIGAAGPWAGMLVALPCVVIGLKLSEITPQSGGLDLGNSVLFYWLSRWMLGVDPSVVNINLHPIAFAGWLGFFVTALNLLPMGQLDGGHVMYALFPRHHRRISTLFMVTCVLMVIVPLALGYSFWGGWLFWAVIALVLGLGHPSTADRDTPLDPRRRRMAWATVALFVLTFMPVPFSLSGYEGTPQQPAQTYDVMHHAPDHAAQLRHLLKI